MNIFIKKFYFTDAPIPQPWFGIFIDQGISTSLLYYGSSYLSIKEYFINIRQTYSQGEIAMWRALHHKWKFCE
jgi:hypothetical protein